MSVKIVCSVKMRGVFAAPVALNRTLMCVQDHDPPGIARADRGFWHIRRRFLRQLVFQLTATAPAAQLNRRLADLT